MRQARARARGWRRRWRHMGGDGLHIGAPVVGAVVPPRGCARFSTSAELLRLFVGCRSSPWSVGSTRRGFLLVSCLLPGSGNHPGYLFRETQEGKPQGDITPRKAGLDTPGIGSIYSYRISYRIAYQNPGRSPLGSRWGVMHPPPTAWSVFFREPINPRLSGKPDRSRV